MVLLAALVIILLAFCLGILLAIRSVDRQEAARWWNSPSDKGRRIDTGKGELFLREEGVGNPTVVILPGWSSVSAEWWPIQEALAPVTRVVTYDRAGYGWSDAATTARTSAQAAEELHRLLASAQLPPPYLLLGHSLGGLYAQHFARKFSTEVAAMVLADPVSVDDHLFDELNCPGFRQFAAKNTRRGQVHRFRRLADWGWLRFKIGTLRSAPAYGLYQKLPVEAQEIFWQNFAQQKFWKTISQEYDRKILGPGLRELAQDKPFPQIPLRIIVRDKQQAIAGLVHGAQIDEAEARKLEELHERLMRELLQLSSQSDWITAAGGSHMMHLTEPETIIETTKILIERLRSEQSLS